MFKKLLIANRGEVAVRIARAARELGVTTVGVASTADADSAWLANMDERVVLGPSAARDSYLDRVRIVQAGRQTGCSAVHPGWGFLAEDARFAALCAQHGMTFVGPPPTVMDRMGLKAPAKAAMRAAGLPLIPGSDGLLADVDEAVRVAKEIGYPVILKADAGGGGRGMRKASDERALRDAWTAASSEAESAFGSGALYLEAYLAGGRHIEVQVLCDAHGAGVHLFERECSVQRKHQKLVEESPSPALDGAQRAELGALAVRAALSIGYVGAGTVEFFRAPPRGDGRGGTLHFMEMNTRLQVEHPVTECVTGVDLVRCQLEVAANRTLASMGVAQDGLRLDGHAIECRVNAEDPEHEFRPSPGRVTAFEVPTDRGPGSVRVDTHLAAGEWVSPHYDSGVAKIIAHARTRDAAIETMLTALRGTRVEGVATTIPLQLAVLASDAFRSGDYDTSAIPGWPAR